MYVWNNVEKRFQACPRNWITQYQPFHNFSGIVILCNMPIKEDCSQDIGEAIFNDGTLIGFNKTIEVFLPEIIIGLSEKKFSGPNWKIKGRIYEESIKIGAKATSVRTN